ncbi:GroES-like protein [Xylona heveae TC161]|uniref:GroES-like protein n=1 Tax=Xylona heveae (strain CBS 132557 / TC161) TaxID=1328760 RepID=A0A165K1I3_XYLHT|nr:GroES-like protein [Xylona heveae TC161]KZF26883.1 GroES-like protein [Xylona heveae TC161]
MADIPKDMRAARLVEFNKPYELQMIPTPRELGKHDLLVKVAVASLCHTDSMVQAGYALSQVPLVASHEGTGTVVALGSEVKDFTVGDRVLCSLVYGACGECADCSAPEGYRQYCSQKAFLGVTQDGFFAEYARIDARESCRLPDRLSFISAAPLACAGITVWRGVVQARLREGQWLAIMGAGGGLGHLGIQFAKARGLSVVAIDARDKGLELCRSAGADLVVDARSGLDKVVQEVHEATKGAGGVDATVNVTDAPNAAAMSCAVTRMHGRVIQIAQPDQVSVPFLEIIIRDIHIEGSLLASQGQAQDMLQTVVDHRISVHTNPFVGLEKVPKLLELAHSGEMKGKAVVVVDEESVEKEEGKDLI